MVKTGFLSSGNRFLLFDFFLQMQAATEINGPFFFGGGNTLFPLEIGNFCLVKNVLFYSVLLSCERKPLVKLVETKKAVHLINGRS